MTTKDTKSTKKGVRRAFPSRDRLCHELKLSGIAFQLQHSQPVEYKSIRLNCACQLDVLVENILIIELKSVDEIMPSCTSCPSWWSKGRPKNKFPAFGVAA